MTARFEPFFCYGVLTNKAVRQRCLSQCRLGYQCVNNSFNWLIKCEAYFFSKTWWNRNFSIGSLSSSYPFKQRLRSIHCEHDCPTIFLEQGAIIGNTYYMTLRRRNSAFLLQSLATFSSISSGSNLYASHFLWGIVLRPFPCMAASSSMYDFINPQMVDSTILYFVATQREFIR